MLAAIVNLTFNFLLIKSLGVYGVISTQLITYLVLVTYRWFDMRRYFVLKFELRTLVPIALMVICAIPFYYNRSIAIDIACMAAAIACMAWPYREEIVSKLMRRLKT